MTHVPTDADIQKRAAQYRAQEPDFARWAAGYGVISHGDLTQVRIHELAERLGARTGDGVPFYDALYALDRIASAGMWLVVHQTYARRVYLDGRRLKPADFKAKPDGHTGGSLNMVPAYAGYLGANVLAGLTRSWLMGQGHCVSAVDSVNVLVGNTTKAHAARYPLNDEGLSRYVEDFYAYRIGPGGKPESPLGSHVNPYTAGSLMEGGYLGFAELQYVHMPLPGERLVAFLSDGAFEEQRGSDWAPRWWRAEDSGLVVPIMISNGRRIDQRTTMSQAGGVEWFQRHLTLNGFEPLVFDGRDPAAFVWAIFEQERRLTAVADEVTKGQRAYPIPLPYGIAVAPKGAGFPGEGTNLAHNLPLMANPRTDAQAAARFHEGAGRLWVAPGDLHQAVKAFQSHGNAGRPLERDHPLAHRDVRLARFATPSFHSVDERTRRGPQGWRTASPMAAVDELFTAAVSANPDLRPRVGNPDEMKSNRLLKTLELLKFRVTAPEEGVPEAVHGAVITALNEEAIAAAALANKGGINLMHTYEAFGMKMHGVLRQEIIFANHCEEAGRPQRWLSIPLCLTSHTWENGKNEQSHQDPSLAETLLGEPSHVARVLFPADFNTAAAVMDQVYRTHGQIWTLVIPKAEVPDLFTVEEGKRLVQEGGLRLDWAAHKPNEARVVLVAIGAYQLMEVLHASRRLAERDIPHRLSYVLEPGRLRSPRSERERAHLTGETVGTTIFPGSLPVCIVTHTRPEPILGLLDPWLRNRTVCCLGYTGHGGTLNTPGMLFVNGCTWAHVVEKSATLLNVAPETLLTEPERRALDGQASPHGVIIPEVGHDSDLRDHVGPLPG